MMFQEAVFPLPYYAFAYWVANVMGGVGEFFWFLGFFLIEFFFLSLNQKWQVIFFQVFPKNVNWTLYEIFKSGSCFKRKVTVCHNTVN